MSLSQFKGPLATPIKIAVYHPTLLGLSAEEAEKLNRESSAKGLAEAIAKIPLLAEHWGLPQSALSNSELVEWLFDLAFREVPGFQLVDANKRGPGAPAKPIDPLELLCAVERIQRDLGPLSDRRVVLELSKDPSFNRRWRCSYGTLLKKLSNARDARANPAYPVWQIADDLERGMLIAIFHPENSVAELS